MPAAIQAEVTMSASARKWVIGRECSHAARPSATGTSRGTPRCGCKGGSQTAGPGHDGGDPDADAQAVARIVGQARPVLLALVDVVDVVRDRPAELAFDRYRAAIRIGLLVALPAERVLDRSHHARQPRLVVVGRGRLVALLL